MLKKGTVVTYVQVRAFRLLAGVARQFVHVDLQDILMYIVSAHSKYHIKLKKTPIAGRRTESSRGNGMSSTSRDIDGLEPMTLANSDNLAGALGGGMHIDRGGRLTVGRDWKSDNVDGGGDGNGDGDGDGDGDVAKNSGQQYRSSEDTT
ncbi:hypothetical protein J1614_003733 [Plenodomus biglobosus]|nr:hypothetical protein J1614_003733 [Plenodomus biglobosus]